MLILLFFFSKAVYYENSNWFVKLFFQVLVWHTRTEKVNLANEPKHPKDTIKIEV